MCRSVRRLLSIILTLWIAITACGQGLYIGGHKAVRDNLNSKWLCSIPRDYFGTDWTTSLVMDSTCTKIKFNNVSIANGDSVTFDSIAGGKEYPFSLIYDGLSMKGKITFTWLPIMELNGKFSTEYASGTVSLNTPDSTTRENDMSAKVKWRGGITNGAGRNKRNYSIKFLDENGDKMDRKLLDLRNDNHWKLDAGQVDMLRVRNRVCTDLWLDMSTKPWYAQWEPKMLNGSRGRPVEVILNQSYFGIFHLIEPIDRKQLKLVKHDTINNLFHGQLWYNKYWNRTGTMGRPQPYSNYREQWDSLFVEYPDFEEVCPTDWSTLADGVFFAYNTSIARDWPTFEDSLSYYFDLPVMMDYMIFIVTLGAVDNESKNVYYSCYDKTIDPRLVMTPWDLDLTLGQKLPTWDDSMVAPDRYIYWISHVPMYNMFFNSRRFNKEIRRRYWQLRETYLDTDSLVNRFRRVINDLEECGAAAREEKRWSKSVDINGQVLDLSAEMDNVEKWIRQRMAYIDLDIFPRVKDVYGDINDDGEVNIADVNAAIDVIIGTAVDEKIISRADVNSDGEVNITDMNCVIGEIIK